MLQRLREAGAEIFVGDLFDMRDLRRALSGVQRAFYCPPFAPNLLHGSLLFALAAEEARLEVVALMSQWNPHESHPSANTREHWTVLFSVVTYSGHNVYGSKVKVINRLRFMIADINIYFGHHTNRDRIHTLRFSAGGYG